MIVSIIYLIISLLLEVIMSNFFQTTLNSISIFTTIYTIIALVIIYPYFNNERKYFILVVASGLLFDILYTSSFIFNLVLFLIVGIVIKTLYSILSENIFDAAFDFASVICDKTSPERLSPVYNCGDNLHPKAEGGQAIADSISLDKILPFDIPEKEKSGEGTN